MESDFVVQSNAPSKEPDANGPLRINSGFYRVRSNPATIAAMEQIVMHAASSRLTEQPSFYMVLCGTKDGTCVILSDLHCDLLSRLEVVSTRPHMWRCVVLI